jgi:hypothetical protein
MDEAIYSDAQHENMIKCIQWAFGEDFVVVGVAKVPRTHAIKLLSLLGLH